MWALILWNLSKFSWSNFSRCPFIKIFPHQNFVPYGTLKETKLSLPDPINLLLTHVLLTQISLLTCDCNLHMAMQLWSL